jgi:choline kinase
MQAVILAAGMGKRLKDLTHNNTKCMVKVNDKTLIERVLAILDTEHLSRIIIVIGYKAKILQDYVGTLSLKTPVIFIENPVFEKTNNIYSLALARDFLIAEDTLLFESDLIFDRKIVDDLLADPRQTLAVVDKFASWMDGTCMKLDSEDHIIDFIPGKYLKFSEKEEYYKTVNIYKFSRHFSENTYVPFLEAYEKAMGNNEYYESVIRLIAMLDTKEICARRLTGEYWYEIDDIQDLEIAETLFNEVPKEKYNAVCHRYGGYWRFPKLIDF